MSQVEIALEDLQFKENDSRTVASLDVHSIAGPNGEMMQLLTLSASGVDFEFILSPELVSNLVSSIFDDMAAQTSATSRMSKALLDAAGNRLRELGEDPDRLFGEAAVDAVTKFLNLEVPEESSRDEDAEGKVIPRS